MIELTIKVKDCNGTLTKRFDPIYEQVTMSEDDPIIKKHIEQALKEFTGEPEDVVVKVRMVIR